MVLYFNKKDLVKFGEYLLSEKRTKRIIDNHNEEDKILIEERIRKVYHSDIENFLHEQKK